MEFRDDLSLYLVFGNAVEGKDDQFNEWYDNVHLPEVLAMPGVRRAQRFDLRETEMTHHSVLPKPTHSYLAVYVLEGDVDEIMGRIQEATMSGKMLMDDSLDFEQVSMSFWAPHAPELSKPEGEA